MRALSFTLALLAATAAQAQSDIQENATFPLGEKHTLTAEGLGWRLTDRTTGKEKNLLLPAFHPELSHPVISGNQLAYISLTKHGDRQQLGCVTFDLNKGKVVNRRDSALVARDDEPLSAPTLDEGGEVNCHLKGEQCNAKGDCTRAEEDVALNFVPGAVAGPPLKAVKGRKGKTTKGTRPGTKAVSGASNKAVKSAHGASPRKAAPKAKSKSTAKKAKHP